MHSLITVIAPAITIVTLLLLVLVSSNDFPSCC